MIPGKRTKKNTFALISDFASRANDGKPPKLFTTDGYAPYADALLEVYGEEVIPERTGKRGRPRKLYKVPPEDLLYATVHKHRRKGKVVDVTVRLVYGKKKRLLMKLRILQSLITSTSLLSNDLTIQTGT